MTTPTQTPAPSAAPAIPAAPAAPAEYLLWLDFETTGLWPESDYPLEVACVVTTAHDLEPLDFYQKIICPPKMALDRMTDYVREMHTKNGLLELVERVGSITPMSVIENDIIARTFHAAKAATPGTVVLAGNTIHFDRRFIARLMPSLHEFLHYRMLDVSAVRHALRVYAPASSAEVERIMAEKDAQGNHRAMGDVQASIEEMRIYRDWLGAAITQATVAFREPR
jgi:oligoribonuclease